MSILNVSNIKGRTGGDDAIINGMPLRPGFINPTNKIINGTFEIWQRGTSQTSNTYSSADRWRHSVSGGTSTQSRQDFVVGTKFGSNNPRHFLRLGVTGQSLTSDYSRTINAIEDVRTFAGETITILGWAKRNSGSGNTAISLSQQFGTGGSTSVAVNAPSQIALTTSWQPFAVTFDVPSITGKTLGTDANGFEDHSLWVLLWASAGSDNSGPSASLGIQTIEVDYWGIHTLLGTHTTDAVNYYRAPDRGKEFNDCLRYYEHSYAYGTYPGATTYVGANVDYFDTTSANEAQSTIFFTTAKRTNLYTEEIYSPVTGASANYYDYTASTDRAADVVGIGNLSMRMRATAAVAGERAAYFHWTCDAELI